MVEGLDELSKKLKKLEKTLGIKTLAQSASSAMNKTKREIQAAAPVGKKAHKTYKGRLVAPGFLKRSVAKRTKKIKRSGRVVVTIGVKTEAFYGVQFLDRGTKHISARRWFEDKFHRNRIQIENEFSAQLKKRIDKI